MDKVLLLFLFALFLLASPLTDWWARGDSVWYLPFLLWGVVIAVALWVERRGEHHDL